MIDLSALVVPPPASATGPVDVTAAVAPINVAPQAWQTAAPPETWGWKAAVSDSDDLERIVALPRRPVPDDARFAALVELVTRRFARPRSTPCRCRELRPAMKQCITRLNATQAWALYEIGLHSGLLGPIDVGFGKTCIDVLAPLAMRDCREALLLLPVGLIGSTSSVGPDGKIQPGEGLLAEYELLGEHFHLPTIVVHARGDGRCDQPDLPAGVGGPAGAAGPRPAPVLHVLPYSKLSRPESTVFLDSLSPDTVICDEVHRLRYANTATTARVLRWFGTHGSARFCGWSGSMTDSSLRDYAHLAALALRWRSPLPLEPDVVEDWCRCLDPVPRPAPMGALVRLCAPGEGPRDGFHRRLVETAGVVSTSAPAIDAELRVEERPAPPMPADLRRMMATVRETKERPDGEVLPDQFAQNRCLRELACGFYYKWFYPRREAREVIDDWFKKRRAWGHELRGMLEERREHLDSPLLCKRAAQRYYVDCYRCGHPLAAHAPGPCACGCEASAEQKRDPHLPYWKSEHWPAWRDVAHQVRPAPRGVLVDDFLARDAAAWAREERGIVWYEHRAFGEWVAKIAELPLHGGGPDAGKEIAKETGDRSIIASLKSHGTGRDGLQRIFDRQLFSNPPSSATVWHQALGRLHRIGQEAPLVRAWFYRHTRELASGVDAALSRAAYVQSTLGAQQKLLVGWVVSDVAHEDEEGSDGW